MLDVRRLRLLRELDRRGTIAAVAHAFSFSPSAISQQLARLQRDAGVQLIERVGRGVQLTPAARSLLGQIDAILDQHDEVESALARIAEEPAGRVRVGAFQTAAIALLPPVLTLLAAEAPAVGVELVETEAEDALPALTLGEVDVVLADEYPGDPRPRIARVEREELGRDRVLLALPGRHPRARSREPVPLAELADERWVFAYPDTYYARMTARACAEVGGFVPKVAHRANDLAVALGLVAAGHALAFVPELVDDCGPDVVLLPVAEGRLERTIVSAARGSSAGHPAVSSVRSALRRVAAERLGSPAGRGAPAASGDGASS
jgi:DNA-binding transcriptional LysR family regulator